MKIGYARVSSSGQHLDMQVSALADVGCEKIYAEKVSGYIGESTRREIAYAERTGKKINYLEN